MSEIVLQLLSHTKHKTQNAKNVEFINEIWSAVFLTETFDVNSSPQKKKRNFFINFSFFIINFPFYPRATKKVGGIRGSPFKIKSFTHYHEMHKGRKLRGNVKQGFD